MPDGIPYAHEDGLWRYGGWKNVDVRTGPRRNRFERTEQLEAIRALVGDAPRVLYAVQFGDGTIKIGCTADLPSRLGNYGPCDVIAFRAGTMAEELAIHHSLRPHLHHGREWYHPTSEVFAVVNDMRDDFGLPHLAA
jgi:hypothetical protein